MGVVLATFGVGVVGFVLGIAVGQRTADADYEPVEWGGDAPTLYMRHSDEGA